MFHNKLARTDYRQNEEKDLKLLGFPLGLNTVVPAEMISIEELATCTNCKINAGGQLETRRAIKLHTTTGATGAIKNINSAPVDGTVKTLVTDADDKLYYLNGTALTSIGTLEGLGQLIPYNDVCIIADGSYLKYIDGISGIKMAYDAGSNGTQFDNISGDDDTELAVGNGTNTRVAVKFTTDIWTTGYTIPITQVDVKLKATGSPSGTITCKLRDTSDDSVLATKDLNLEASVISASGETVTFTFLASDITTEMSPGTDYYCTIEHSGGDATNYIGLECTTLASGGRSYYYAGSWSADATKQPIIKVYPGTPPKASFGTIAKNRPFLAGDPDNPGYVWFGNFTYLDFSTPDGGGYVSTIDENRNTFEVGGIESLYGDVIVYGTEGEPYLAKLLGNSPSEYSLPLMFQKSWTLSRTLINVGNDLWSASRSGVDALSGVETYGDMRAYSESDRVQDIIKNNWDSNTFAGYYPEDRQFWLFFPNYSKVLVANLGSKIIYEDQRIHYPWSEYLFPSDLTPTAFGTAEGVFYIGGGDGDLYKFDKNEYKDYTNAVDGPVDISPCFTSSYIDLPYTSSDIQQIQAVGKSVTGSTYNIKIFTNGIQAEAKQILVMSFAVSDVLTIDDLEMYIEDLEFTLDANFIPKWKFVNINCWSFQLEISDIKITGQPVYFNGFFIKLKNMEL